MGNWIFNNWLNIINAIAAVGSLLFATLTIRADTEAKRVGHFLDLVVNHRELWSLPLQYPALKRVLEIKADLRQQPITFDEKSFTNMVIQHLSGGYQVMKAGLVIKQEGLRRDVHQFFSLPIPRAIWKEIKPLQNDDFAAFVDQCLDRK